MDLRFVGDRSCSTRRWCEVRWLRDCGCGEACWLCWLWQQPMLTPRRFLRSVRSTPATAAQPEGGLTLNGSTLLGTTVNGGANGYGSVFSVPMTGGNPMLLASFTASTGEDPTDDLALNGNTLYGTTQLGGAYGDGTIFSLPVTGGSPTVLASFVGGNGQQPYAGLTPSGGSLYGTTVYGGTNDTGTIFSLSLSGGSPAVLATFSGSNGACPYGDLTLSSSTLFGTTRRGGPMGTARSSAFRWAVVVSRFWLHSMAATARAPMAV